jgi:hypothetical protein
MLTTTRRAIAASVLLTYLVSMVGHGDAVVLCVSHGRVAIRSASCDRHELACARAPQEGPIGLGPERSRPDGTACECCVGIPIPLGAAAPHTNDTRSPAPQKAPLPLGLDLAALPQAKLGPPACSGASPPDVSPQLASLRTVILLS